MTEEDWNQVLTELDHNIYYLTENNVKDLAGILLIIKDNIRRQTAL